MAANVKFIRTSKEKQNNRQLTNQFDHSALYFVTDSRQLYRANQLLTSGIRIVDSYQALPRLEAAAEEILYFTKAQGNGYALQADRSAWLLVFESNKTFLDQIANTYVTKEAFDTKIGSIEEAIANIQAAQQLERQLRQVQTKVVSVESTVQEVTGTVEVVATTVTQVAGTVNQVTSKVQTIDSTVVQVATKVEAIDSTVATIDSTVATIAPVVDQVAELQACIDDMDTVHAQLRAGIDAKVNITEFTPVKQQAAGNNVKILALDEQLFGVKQTIETLATKDELEEAIAAIQHPTVDLNGYATETYVDNKVAEIKVPGKVSDLENDLDYLTEHQDISHLATTEYLTTELGGKADKEHEHSQYLTKHQDLTDYAKKSDIPDISGKADISHTHQEYLTELPEHNHDDIYAKLNDISQLQSQVLFSENYYVTKPIGNFVLGQNVNTLTIRKLFEALLGLSTTEPSTPDEPDTPVQPEGIVEEIIVNKLPMYQLNENDELVEVAFVEPIKYKVEAAEVTAAIEEARLINDGQVGFYQVVSGTGEVIESGYQDITESKEPWYIIALPESLEVTRSGNVELLTWDTTAKPPVWVEASYVLTSDYTEITTAYEDADLEPPVAPPGHKLWADLSESDPGTQYRFVIKDKE